MNFVDMYHPELDTTVTVAEISVETHKQNGWMLVADETPDVPAEDLLVDADNDETTTQED